MATIAFAWKKRELIRANEYELLAAVHPAAVVADSVTLGVGTVVMAGVVVNWDAKIGENVILNTGCTVDHDCVIGDGVHISPGVHLAGDVTVGERAHIGIGGVCDTRRNHRRRCDRRCGGRGYERYPQRREGDGDTGAGGLNIPRIPLAPTLSRRADLYPQVERIGMS